ncbi:MAG: RNase adapter RapZ [Defluviitoga tunisiensis]|nr:RNase adapter RapZ [Defluviitoga tunisiensis]MDY0379266.1 RNase adapter RapZ [Defluviitoga tunisiensis]HOB55311.1 RNase adapter RapZ [Defluviitoga tunisiensis]HOK16196.1 RNase adapter RapZ [Defluviitoga tunisiensis]HOL86519.1 RNase adapter RapZ [Defluviitoga tunisiensis]
MKNNPVVFLITGLSGAGKSTLLRALEDEQYFTVDNVPPNLIEHFLNILCTSNVKKLAIVSDIRWKDPESLYDVFNNVEKLAKCNMEIHKVFLKADKPTIIDRYKKSRRIHPLEKSLEIAIDEEIKIMSKIEKLCDIVIDTTSIEPTELKKDFFKYINENMRKLRLNIISFGFKEGIPSIADYLIDVRYLPNPFYFPEMYQLTGLDEKVINFLEQFPETNETINKLVDFAKFIQDKYSESGRFEAYFCIGCTGGQHRSVYVAQKLYDILKADGREVSITHRDLERLNN